MKTFVMALCAALFCLVLAACEGPVISECDNANCDEKSDAGTKTDATPAQSDASACKPAAEPAISASWTPFGDGLAFYPKPGTIQCRSWDAWGTTVQTWTQCQLSAAADKDGLNGWIVAKFAASVSCDQPPMRCSDPTTKLREWLPVFNAGTSEYICAVGSDVGSPAPSTGVCSGKAAGSICRASAGPCDLVEVCDGVSADCPPDRVQGNGTTCNVPNDGTGTCDGTTVTCHATPVTPTDKCSGVVCSNGLVCDPTNGECTVPSLVTCHGLVVEDPGNAGQCIWYARTAGTALGVFSSVDNVRAVGPDGACSVVCQNTPTLCSGTWQNDHEQTWSSAGGTNPAGGLGCAWDNKHTH